jgi:drug/metabolite transporter (DMT)-like permease
MTTDNASRRPFKRPSAPLSRQRQAELSLVFLTMIWGTTFIATRTALSGISPLMLLGIRFAVGFIALFVLFFPRMRRITRMDVRAGLVLGILFFVGNVLQTTGLKYTTAGVSGFITALSVVMVPPIALVVLKEKPRIGALVGVILAMIGLALLTLGDGLSAGLGELLTVGCAIAFAFHIVYVTKYGSVTEPTVMVAVQLGLSAIAAFAMAGLTGTAAAPSPAALKAAIYLGLVATAFAFVMQVYAQRLTTATRAALIFTLEPVFAAIFAYLVAGEVIGPRGLAGCALILIGTLVAELL